MSEKDMIKADAAAQKAYADAAEAIPAKAEAASAEATPVAFPPKATRGSKSVTKVPATPEPAPVAAKVPAVKPKPVPIVPAPVAKVAKPAAKLPIAKAAAKPVSPPARPALLKPQVSPVPAAIPTRTVSNKKAAPKPAPTKPTIAVSTPLLSQIKDKTMNATANFTETFKGTFTEVQSKAKEALEKSSAAFADYNDFAKGNVEAVVESGKILAAGLQDFGTNVTAESRSAFETATADFKELAAVKSPADFFKLQSELFRRNFDTAVAYGSKTSEAMLKLTSEAFAPISGRVSLAVEKVRTTA